MFFAGCGKLNHWRSMNTSKSIKILYIEDDSEMLDLVTLILSRKGLQVDAAHGGKQGLEMVKAKKPDIILLDLMMPDMDGWDVYHFLKNDEDTSNIPVIIITAKAQTIDKVLGLKIARVDDYICKPFRPQEILESIERIMNKQTSVSG
jgi:two-component system response regulator VicR